MIFRQMFDSVSSTYTYLIASRQGGEALLLDPVEEHTYRYTQLINELGLKLVLAADTHIHADHITALGKLREETGCATAMGDKTKADCVSTRFTDGEKLQLDGIDIQAIYTPGHTDDSYSFRLPDRVLTGDTLLIRGTGRTDFQNGNSGDQYDSLFKRLLTLPDETLVYPAHDYNGMTVSSISEEKRFNPRLQVTNRQAYIDMMDNLSLDKPKLMDIAVPANQQCGTKPSSTAMKMEPVCA